MRAFNPPDWTAARLELRDILTDFGWPDSTISDAELALHELIVNAWMHAGNPAPLVVLALRPGRLRVSVSDDNPALLPDQTPCTLLSESGRGLHLVRALTHRFGTDLCKQGKSVWFELDSAA
ncbi:ATP-binding protein [Kitasatospora aureofaciens]|uniref:ATP-binding protein n=1 Tax=Kitasatospora aureofaciens TaxID=1894 RepID=UPI001C48CF2A|nr:ATP-binding protein [Kitasatospora aureofaciens]MBV6698634.1 ATP-binding protein [Kitasatospora aureofaciens]